MPPVTTALYGALNAILNIYLANRVSNTRRARSVSLGDGNDPAVVLAARIHANNAEFVPLAIVMMLLVELCGGSSIFLHSFGGTLLVARMAHAFGMPRKAPNPFRFMGTALTWTGIVACAGYVLFLRFQLVGR